MSGIGFGITSLGIKCPELDLESQVLESYVLESGVRNWYCRHVSSNHTSVIRHPGIRCLESNVIGIKCLSTNVLESPVHAPDMNQISGYKCLGIKGFGIK